MGKSLTVTFSDVLLILFRELVVKRRNLFRACNEMITNKIR